MKKIILAIFTLASFAFAGQGFVLMETSKGGKELIKAVSDAVMKAGFVPADERDLNVAYQKQFEQSDFELYYNLTVFDPKTLGQVLPSNPKLAGFVPCSVFFYKLKNEPVIHVGFPPTKNWVVHTNVTNAEHIKIMQEAENVAKNMLKEAAE